MRRTGLLIAAGITCVGALSIATAPIQAQAAVFAGADVHASPLRPLTEPPSFALTDGQYRVRNATMLDLIATAYGVRGETIVGGPSWLELDRFDIVALTP